MFAFSKYISIPFSSINSPKIVHNNYFIGTILVMHNILILIINMTFYCDGKIGNLLLKLQILSMPEEWAQGYQHQSAPNGKEGLLFVFDDFTPRSFHMRNVNFDLMLLGFDENGKMVCKFPMKANAEIFYKTPPCKFIVEIPRSLASFIGQGKNFLKVGNVEN